MIKKSLVAASVVSAILMSVGASTTAFAQPVAGTATLGVSVSEVQAVAMGWSIKKSILGKKVYNDDKKVVGKVEDVIVAPDNALSYAIVGVGGFLGMAKHDVAIPINQFKSDGKEIMLSGASKDALKALPKFEYTHK